VDSGSLRLKRVASLVNENDYEAAGRVVLCDSGLNFLQEAQKFFVNREQSKDFDTINQLFYNFVRQSLMMYSLARN